MCAMDRATPMRLSEIGQEAMSSTSVVTDPLQDLRRRWHSRANCCFLEPQEFLQRATSRHPHTRADEPQAALSGLLDGETGMLFLVESEKLGRVAAF